MDTDGKIVLTLILAILALFCIGGIGWCKTLVALANCDFEKPYNAEVLRAAGVIIAPVGAVIGYMHINDGEEKEKDHE